MTLSRVTALCLLIAAIPMSGAALAEDVLVRFESVKGEALVYWTESPEDIASMRVIRVQAGDVLIAPLTIETGPDGVAEFTVRGYTLSVAPNSSIVVDDLPVAISDSNEQ